MAGRNKKKRILEAQTFANVVQGAQFLQKIQLSSLFPTPAPITLELGCGKGGYTIGLAQLYPQRNFVGVDIKADRIWVGAKQALEAGQKNVLFLQTKIERLTDFFAPQTIEQIWITFPDPFPRQRQAKHRLTALRFLAQYRSLLRAKGRVFLKTDDEDLFLYTIEQVEQARGRIVRAIANVYSQTNLPPEFTLQTDFEKKHLERGKKIFLLEFAWLEEG